MANNKEHYMTCLGDLSMRPCMTSEVKWTNAPINVNPEGGGSGKGWGFDQSGGPMGRDLD